MADLDYGTGKFFGVMNRKYPATSNRCDFVELERAHPLFGSPRKPVEHADRVHLYVRFFQ